MPEGHFSCARPSQLYRISWSFCSEGYQCLGPSSAIRCIPQVTVLLYVSRSHSYKQYIFHQLPSTDFPLGALGTDQGTTQQSIALPRSSHNKLVHGASCQTGCGQLCFPAAPQNNILLIYAPISHFFPKKIKSVSLQTHSEIRGSYISQVHSWLRCPAEHPFWNQKIRKKENLLTFLQPEG